jgi:hypothetical protein
MLGRVEVLLGEVQQATREEPRGAQEIMAAGAAWEAKLAALARRIKKLSKVREGEAGAAAIASWARLEAKQ